MSFAAECARQMGCYVIAAALIFGAGVIGFGVVGYRYGYDQGRNDGFKSGWRESMETKELPEPPREDE